MLMTCAYRGTLFQPDVRIRTLLADDAEAVLRNTGMLLKLCGRIELIGTAKDGVEALESVRRHRPDLVLLDVQMPRKNGLEAAAKIAQESPATRIVLFSSHNDAELRRICLDSGAHLFLSKHRLPQEFCTCLENLFGPCLKLDPPLVELP